MPLTRRVCSIWILLVFLVGAPARATVVKEAAWSPGGQWLLILAPAEKADALQLMEPTLERIDRTLFQAPGLEGASWSPDGTNIAFIRQGSLATVTLDGSVVTPVTNDATMKVEGYSWSPQSQQLAVVRTDTDAAGTPQLLIFDRENRQATHTHPLPAALAHPTQIAWSPLDTAVTLCAQGYLAVYDVRYRTLHEVPVQSGASGIVLWSASGEGFAFVASTPASTDFLLARADGTPVFRASSKGGLSYPIAVRWPTREILCATSGSAGPRADVGAPHSLVLVRGDRQTALAGAVALRFAPTLWLLPSGPGLTSSSRATLGRLGLIRAGVTSLATPGWCSAAPGPAKLIVFAGTDADLDSAVSFLARNKVARADIPSAAGHDLAVLAPAPGGYSLTLASQAQVTGHEGASPVHLAPPKHAQRPNWLWPAVTVFLVVLTFLAGMAVTVARNRH